MGLPPGGRYGAGAGQAAAHGPSRNPQVGHRGCRSRVENQAPHRRHSQRTGGAQLQGFGLQAVGGRSLIGDDRPAGPILGAPSLPPLARPGALSRLPSPQLGEEPQAVEPPLQLPEGDVEGDVLEVLLADAEQAVLSAVEHDVLRMEVVETALCKAVATLQASNGDGADAHVTAVRDELAGLDAEVGRLAQAIAQGGDLPALVALLQDRECRRARVRAALAEVERKRASHGDVADLAHVLDAMRAALTDWQGLLRQETGPARRAMQALLQGRLVFNPQERDGERFYTFEGAGTISPVIAGAAGLQRVWCPRAARCHKARAAHAGRRRPGGLAFRVACPALAAMMLLD